MTQRFHKAYRKAQRFCHWLYIVPVAILILINWCTIPGYASTSTGILIEIGLLAITPLVSRILALPFAFFFFPFCEKMEEMSKKPQQSTGNHGGGSGFSSDRVSGGSDANMNIYGDGRAHGPGVDYPLSWHGPNEPGGSLDI